MVSIPVTVWLVLTLSMAAVTVLAVWSRANTRARFLCFMAFFAAVPASGAALGFSLGWPVHLVNGVTVRSGETKILGAKMIIDDGIYILVDRGDQPPRYVRIPWDPDTASKLQGAMDEAGPEGDVTMTVPPFEFSWDGHAPQFHAQPQPKVLPDKLQPPEPPVLGDQI